MKRLLWLFLLVAVSCEAAWAQGQSIDELRRPFDYDQNEPVDVKEVSVINRNGIQIHDITYGMRSVGPILQRAYNQRL